MSESKKLRKEEVELEMKELPLWRMEGGSIMRVFDFPDFKNALNFVNKIGDLAEKSNHHPDIKLSWGRAEVRISTHSAGGITSKDFKLAEEVDALPEYQKKD